QELKKLAPGFAWEKFLAHAKMAKLARVIVAEKSAFPKIVDAYVKAPLDTIRAWQAFHLADNAAPYLSKAVTDAYFDLHAKTLSGQKEQQARWKRAITAVSGGDFFVGDSQRSRKWRADHGREHRRSRWINPCAGCLS